MSAVIKTENTVKGAFNSDISAVSVSVSLPLPYLHSYLPSMTLEVN